MPNAGKSTLLRALAAAPSRSAVVAYPFMTLNPIIVIVHIAEDGSLVGDSDGDVVGVFHDEMAVEERREPEQKLMASNAYADMAARNPVLPTYYSR